MLFLKELKKAALSIPFFILIAALLLMVYSQGVLCFTEADKISEPKPGMDNYGTKLEEAPEVIMPAALSSLYMEFLYNSYAAYPIGFLKQVKLSDEKQQAMADILAKLSGEDAKVIYDSYTAQSGLSLAVDAAVNYEQFCQCMEEASGLIGPGSSYEKDALLSFSQVPMTYEDGMASYDLVKTRDRFLGAYARLFTDYALIVLAVLPVFMGVAMSLKDKHSKMTPQIYTRSIASWKLVLVRYGAIVVLVGVTALIAAYISNISVWKLYPGESLDYLAPLKYTLGWIMPSVLVSAAVGMVLTELTNTPAAIVFMGLWWFVDINTGIRGIGDYPLWQLMPRHNDLQKTDMFLAHFKSLVANRLCLTLAAFILVFLCIIIVERKRRGKMLCKS